VLARFDFRIIVEGYTDDRPINTATYQSNRELSSARAASVVRYLEDQGVDPWRMAVHAYGPHRPVALNNTKDNRALNRRIEIMLVPDSRE
jgi:chemotaxis protein MotB